MALTCLNFASVWCSDSYGAAANVNMGKRFSSARACQCSPCMFTDDSFSRLRCKTPLPPELWMIWGAVTWSPCLFEGGLLLSQLRAPPRKGQIKSSQQDARRSQHIQHFVVTCFTNLRASKKPFTGRQIIQKFSRYRCFSSDRQVCGSVFGVCAVVSCSDKLRFPCLRDWCVFC